MPVERWYEIVGDPTLADAILDRLVHNAHRIALTGETRRKQANMKYTDHSRRWTPSWAVSATAMRNVTEVRTMPRGRKPDADHALSNAERQARYRARCATSPPKAATHPRRPTDRRSRPKRWRDAVAELLTLQAEYAAWSDALPESLREGAMAQTLQDIVDLDLDTLAAITPPRGYGRD